MMVAGVSRRGAFAGALSVGLASVVGVLVVSVASTYVGAALALSTGVTLYVAASDLIPEVNRDEGAGMALLVFAGVALFYVGERALEWFGF